MLSVALSALLLVGMASAHSMRHFPRASCKPEDGKLCFPDACKSTKCLKVEDAICIPDRCGCQARFFLFSKETKLFHDVSKLCIATNTVDKAAGFVKDLSTSHKTREEISNDLTENSTLIHKTFASLNLLASEALEAVAWFLKESSEKAPTVENVHRFQVAIEKLRTLERNRQRYGIRRENLELEGSDLHEGFKHHEKEIKDNRWDIKADGSHTKDIKHEKKHEMDNRRESLDSKMPTDMTEADFVAMKGIWKVLVDSLREALEVGSKMCHALKDLKKEKISKFDGAKTDSKRIVLMDEDTGETAEINDEFDDQTEDDVESAVQEDMEIANDLLADDGSFSDILADDQ